MAVHRGDTITLSNGSRTLTVLRVASLRVDLAGGEITGGSCSPDQYFGAPLTSAPTSLAAGFPTGVVGGAEGTGNICRSNGDPAGLPADTLAQTDDTSGGQTVTEVADVADMFPLAGETMFGSFTALADPTDATSPIALSILHGGTPVFSASNVNTANGVAVPALSPGIYTANWVVSDANGDTRTVSTRFVEQPALQGPQGPQGATGPQGSRRVRKVLRVRKDRPVRSPRSPASYSSTTRSSARSRSRRPTVSGASCDWPWLEAASSSRSVTPTSSAAGPR